MKTRNDFVSNSSSCSFIISTNNTYSKKDLIKDIAKKCDDEYEYMFETINEYVALYVGYMCNNYRSCIISKNSNNENEVKYFNEISVHLDMDKDETWYTKHCKYLNDKHTLIKYTSCDFDSKVVSICEMENIMKMNDEELMNYINNIEYGNDTIYSYQINNDSLTVTRRLLKLGKKFDWYNKNTTLENLEEMLLNNEKIYNISINYEGNGRDNTSFYCYDMNKYPEIFNGLAIEILATEQC
jgi:hypothetical protein